MARPRSFDEDAVLARARDRFWATGYAGTSMDAIAAATGLGKGSLYGSFGGKREMFHRIFDDYCTAAVGSADDLALGGDDGAITRLTEYFREHARTSAEAGHRACLLAKGAAELAEHDEVVAERSRRALEGLRDAFAAALRAGQRTGDIDDGADAGPLADLLVVVHRGVEALGEVGTDAATLRQTVDAALAGLPRARRRPTGRSASREDADEARPLDR